MDDNLEEEFAAFEAEIDAIRVPETDLDGDERKKEAQEDGKRKRVDDDDDGGIGDEDEEKRKKRRMQIPSVVAATAAPTINKNYLSSMLVGGEATRVDTQILADQRAIELVKQRQKEQERAPFYGPVIPDAIIAKHSDRKQQTKGKERKKKRFLREAGGEVWEDKTLEEWPENDFRIFVGNLGGDVTDEKLLATFRNYKSATKARVVLSRSELNSRGYGFVSFTEPQDMLKALREMNGKYCGSKPMQIKRCKWKDRALGSKKS